MADQRTRVGARARLARVAVAAAVGGAVLTAGAGRLAAGELPAQPQASATSECRTGQGFILVTIIDSSEGDLYDVTIGETLVADNMGSTDGGSAAFGPYANGTYSVVVEWVSGEAEIFATDVVVSCVAPTTTLAPTTTTTTVAPTTTIGAGVAAHTTVPLALPATGADASPSIALIALVTLAAGSLLVVVATRRRSAT